ncbi:MAG: hypothetical protein U1F52_06300 [Burkholderiales bacterium]
MSRRRDLIAELFREDLAGWRSIDAVSGVRIASRGEACEHCRSLLGDYRWDTVPAFPPRCCADEYGCSSWWEPLVESG